MNAIKSIKEKCIDLYLVAVISLLGVFAFISAILIAWPALAFLGAKFFA